ncbi:MAG: ArsR/SmtB family transcription factor [Limnochordia bacterium]|jgi:DNA-binding transcriptional ArsR family regulator
MDPRTRRLFQLHAEVCQTLANPRRLEILHWLRQGEKSVDELATLTGIQKSSLSQHLALLRQKRLVRSRRDGLYIYYEVANPKILEACDILKEVLQDSLAVNQDLISLLEGEENED